MTGCERSFSLRRLKVFRTEDNDRDLSDVPSRNMIRLKYGFFKMLFPNF